VAVLTASAFEAVERAVTVCGIGHTSMAAGAFVKEK
jgi:hypothetical protein